MAENLVRFIRLNEGKLGRNRREREFEKLTDDEVASIEAIVFEAFEGFEDQENTPSARRIGDAGRAPAYPGREGRQMPNMNSERLGHLIRFYSIIEVLESNIGGAKRLTDCSGLMSWPKRGVYFFREPGENRTNTGEDPRVVRVGMHALKSDSRMKLWARLSQHKGSKRAAGGGLSIISA